MPQTIGVLGGMGPEATLLFLDYLLRLTPARSDQEHLPVIVFNDPRIPDRTEAIFGTGESPLPMLQDFARRLEEAGAELLVIPCNTAHYFWEGIIESISIPALNILDTTVEQILRFRGENAGMKAKIGILATNGTIRMNLYQERLERSGYEPITPDEAQQRETQQLIKSIKAGVPRSETGPVLQRLIEHLVDRGAEGVILGCTELGLALNGAAHAVPLFDSLMILAEKTVLQAGGQFRKAHPAS